MSVAQQAASRPQPAAFGVAGVLVVALVLGIAAYVKRVRPSIRVIGVEPAGGDLPHEEVVDYARRKGMSVAEVERWLAPNLGYEP